MQDVLAHYHMYDYRARCVVAITTETVRDAMQRHDLDPVTTIAVGRAITTAALLASTLKGADEYVHLSFAAHGLVRRVVGECNGQGHCRGYSTPTRIEQVLQAGMSIPEGVGEALGRQGTLTVTRGRLGEHKPYNATCELLNGEIASDVARFLTESEQIPSAVAAGVKLSSTGDVTAAGGVLVQRLGGAELSEAALSDLERRLTTELHLTERLTAGNDIDEIVEYLQGSAVGFGRLMDRPLSFKCTCSRAKMSSALFALGQEELKNIRKETGKIEIRCQYCGTAQSFSLAELTPQ